MLHFTATLVLAGLAVTYAGKRGSRRCYDTPDRNAYRRGEFMLGVDYSYLTEHLDFGTTYVDTDNVTKSIFELFKGHGINTMRVRTFVDPEAPFGYATGVGEYCYERADAYGGVDDIVRQAKLIKEAGMAFVLDFHYSDTWADPGKQVIPAAWRNSSNIDELASHVFNYTQEVLETLCDEKVLPDVVQIGNEITNGLLKDVPTENTDCFGNNGQSNPTGVTGDASPANWDNLAKLLRAGIRAANKVSRKIKTLIHIEDFNDPRGMIGWVQATQSRGVTFDILGLSAYETFQGPSEDWNTTVRFLADTFPDLSFSIVEYNQEGRLLAEIMHELPNDRGQGTFFWEPTESGFWGDAIFTWNGNQPHANAEDFAVFDGIADDFGLRRLP